MNLLSSAPSMTTFGRQRLWSTAHSLVPSSRSITTGARAFASIIIIIYGPSWAMWSVPKLESKKKMRRRKMYRISASKKAVQRRLFYLKRASTWTQTRRRRKNGSMSSSNSHLSFRMNVLGILNGIRCDGHLSFLELIIDYPIHQDADCPHW